MSMKVALEKFEIRNANISYNDGQAGMKADIASLNFMLTGNMGLDYTELQIDTKISGLDFIMDGMRYIRNANVGFNAGIVPTWLIVYIHSMIITFPSMR